MTRCDERHPCAPCAVGAVVAKSSDRTVEEGVDGQVHSLEKPLPRVERSCAGGARRAALERGGAGKQPTECDPRRMGS